MRIILLILKILGFGILGILALALLLILYVLFVPIRYDISGEFQEKKLLIIRAFDLLRIVGFSFTWNPEDTKVDIRILWKHFIGDEPSEEGSTEEESEEYEDISVESTVSKARDTASASTSESTNTKHTKSHEYTKKRSKKRSSNHTLAKIQRMLEDDVAMEGLRGLLQRGIAILREIRPHIASYDIEFYTGEPDTTGELIGLLATIPWIYRDKKHRILPDFSQEEPYLYGYMKLQGSVPVIRFVGLGVYFLFNKNVRRLRAHIKRF